MYIHSTEYFINGIISLCQEICEVVIASKMMKEKSNYKTIQYDKEIYMKEHMKHMKWGPENIFDYNFKLEFV